MGYLVSYGGYDIPDVLIMNTKKCPYNYNRNDKFDFLFENLNQFKKDIFYVLHMVVTTALIVSIIVIVFSLKIPIHKSHIMKIYLNFRIFPFNIRKNEKVTLRKDGASNIFEFFLSLGYRFISFDITWEKTQKFNYAELLSDKFSSTYSTNEETKQVPIETKLILANNELALSFAIEDIAVNLKPKSYPYMGHSAINDLFRLCSGGFSYFLHLSSAKDLQNTANQIKCAVDVPAVGFGYILDGRIHMMAEAFESEEYKKMIHDYAKNFFNEKLLSLEVIANTFGKMRVWGTSIIYGSTRFFVVLIRTNTKAVLRGPEFISTNLMILGFSTAVSMMKHGALTNLLKTHEGYLREMEFFQNDVITRFMKKNLIIPFDKEFNLIGEFQYYKSFQKIVKTKKNCIVTLKSNERQVLVIHTPHSSIGGFIHLIQEQKVDPQAIALPDRNIMAWLCRVSDASIVWVMASDCKELGDITQIIHPQDRDSFIAAVEHTRRFKPVEMSTPAKIIIGDKYRIFRVTLIRNCEEYFVVIAVDEEDYSKSILELKRIEKTVSIALSAGNVTLWNYEDTYHPPRILLSWGETAFIANRTTVASNVLNEYQAPALEQFDICMRTGVPFMIDVPLLVGTLKWYSMRGIRTGPSTLLLLNIDITQTKEAEERLIEEKRRVEEATNAKTRFLANMSHDIRNPLYGINGLLELLMDTNLPPGNDDNIDILTNSFEKLLDLLNDTLDLAKIEQNKMIPSWAPFDPAEEVGKIIQKFKRPHVPVITKTMAGFPTIVYGEPHFFSRIVSNLLSNAVKFTHEGMVMITMTSDMESSITVKIEDSGIGISTEDVERLFTIFAMGDNSIRRPYGGIGVGLPLCQKMLNLIGGKLELSSIVGKGSKFTVICPFEIYYVPFVPRTIKEKELYALDLTGVDLYHELLEPHCKFFGIPLLKNPDDSKPISIIFLTNRQNAIDTALEIIRKRKNVVALMSYNKGEEILYQGVEIRRELSPVRLGIIVKILKEVAWNKGEDKDNIKIAPISVLLAEDNATNQLYMRKMFQKLGVSLVVVGNGMEAVEKLKEEKFDLVFLDQCMPVLDGPSAAVEIRKFNKDVTIIALTASHSKDDEMLCLSAGMNAFLTKPVSISNIRCTLMKFSPR